MATPRKKRVHCKVPGGYVLSTDAHMVISTWNRRVADYCPNCPPVRFCVRDSARAKNMERRLNEPGFAEAFGAVCEAIAANKFLRGDAGNNSGWSATLDWLLQPGNWNKVIEG